MQREGPYTLNLGSKSSRHSIHNINKDREKVQALNRQKPISHIQLLKPISDDGARWPQLGRDHRWPMGGVDYDNVLAS